MYQSILNSFVWKKELQLIALIHSLQENGVAEQIKWTKLC